MKALLAGLLLTAPAPVQPVTTVQADCVGITVTSEGYAPGSVIFFGPDGEPPVDLATNTAATWPWSHVTFDGLHYWSVQAPDGSFQSGQVSACAEPVTNVTTVPPPATTEPAVVVELVTPSPQVEWGGLSLASPW